MKNKKITAVIRIGDLTVPQAIALEDMLATWEQLGSAGSSRWTSFFADGDGDFRPTILYNGYKPQKTELLEKEEVWRGNDYRIDFDCIGWKLLSNEDICINEIKKARKIRIFIGTLRFLFQGWIESIKKKRCKKLPASGIHPERNLTCDGE